MGRIDALMSRGNSARLTQAANNLESLTIFIRRRLEIGPACRAAEGPARLHPAGQYGEKQNSFICGTPTPSL